MKKWRWRWENIYIYRTENYFTFFQSKPFCTELNNSPARCLLIADSSKSEISIKNMFLHFHIHLNYELCSPPAHLLNPLYCLQSPSFISWYWAAGLSCLSLQVWVADGKIIWEHGRKSMYINLQSFPSDCDLQTAAFTTELNYKRLEPIHHVRYFSSDYTMKKRVNICELVYNELLPAYLWVNTYVRIL